MPSSSRHERSRFSGGTLVLFGALCLAAYLWTAFERSGPLVPKWLFAAGLLLLAAVPLVSPLRGALAVFFLVPFFGNFPGGRWVEVLNVPLSAGIVGLLLYARRRRLPPPAGWLWAAALLCVASAALAFIPSLEGVAVRLAQINSLPEAVVETLSARETDPLYSLSSLLLLVLAAAWAYALAWASPGSAFATNALRAVAASFFVVMVLGALDLHHRIDLQSYLKRIDERSLGFEGFQSIFWNPGWFSWYFVMAFGLVMGLLWLESRPVRWLLGAGLAVSYVYSFGNPQRGGFLALHAALGVAVLCLLASFVSKRRNLVWAAAVLCVAAVLAVIAFRVVPKPEGRGTAWARLTSGLETDSARKNLAATAARMWSDSPLFGIGEGSFCWRYGEYVRVGSDPSTDAAFGDAHSTWLQLLATRGILGLAAFLGLLLPLGRRAVRAVRGAGPERGIGLGLGFSLIAFLTYSFVQYMFYLQGIQALFWGIVALAAIVSPEFREERPLPRVARWALAAAGLGALILQLGLSGAQLARGAARVRLEPRGFYPVEIWGAEGPMRWSSRNGTLCLYPSARTLSLRMLTADPDARNRSIAVSIRANGRVLDRFDLKDAVVRERSFDLQKSELVRPPEGERPFGQCVKGARSLHLSIEVSRTWSPLSRGVSGDTRHLGVAVFEPKFSSGAAEPAAKISVPVSLPGGPEKELWVGPFGAQRVEVRMLLPTEAKVRPGDRLTGKISLFDAAVLPVDSFPERLPGGRWLLQFFLPYDALSPEVLVRSSAESIDYRLAGTLRSGAVWKPIEFRGRIPRDHVQLTESMRVTLRRFVRVSEMHLGHVGLKRVTVNVDLDILAPFRFDLKLLEARYQMDVGERTVSRGQREKFLLHAGRWNRLQFPIQIEYSGVLAAAGKTAASRGQVDGKLTGIARLRLPSGDLDFPFEFPVKMALP